MRRKERERSKKNKNKYDKVVNKITSVSMMSSALSCESKKNDDPEKIKIEQELRKQNFIRKRMILRGYSFKNKPKIKYESFEKSIDEINQNLTNTISLINEYSKTKQRILSIQNKIKKKTNFIPFLRTDLQCKLRKKSMTPSVNQETLIQKSFKKQRTRNSDDFVSGNIRSHNFTDLKLSIPYRRNSFFNISDCKDQQSSASSTQTQTRRLKRVRYNKEFVGSVDVSAMRSTLLSGTNSIDEMEEYLDEDQDQANFDNNNLIEID